MRKPTAVDADVLATIRRLTGADEGGDGQGFALKSEISAAMPGVDITSALQCLEVAGKIKHSVYGYWVATRRRP